jgi:hypothetical protein
MKPMSARWQNPYPFTLGKLTKTNCALTGDGGRLISLASTGERQCGKGLERLLIETLLLDGLGGGLVSLNKGASNNKRETNYAD